MAQTNTTIHRQAVFAELLQGIVLNHSKYSASEIAVRMYGDSHVERNTKMLYRRINPNDHGAYLAAIDLPAFIDATDDNTAIHNLAAGRNLVVFCPPPIDGTTTACRKLAESTSDLPPLNESIINVRLRLV